MYLGRMWDLVGDSFPVTYRFGGKKRVENERVTHLAKLSNI